MSSAGVRNNSLCKLDNESGGIDWPYCISFQTRPLLICADSQFGSLHTVRRRCTFQLRVHFIVTEFFVLSGFTPNCEHFARKRPRTRGQSIYLSMPPSARSMKKQHQHFFSDQRSESVSQHVFCRSYFGGVKPLLLTASVTCLFASAPAGLMTHSPAGRLPATAWVDLQPGLMRADSWNML